MISHMSPVALIEILYERSTLREASPTGEARHLRGCILVECIIWGLSVKPFSQKEFCKKRRNYNFPNSLDPSMSALCMKLRKTHAASASPLRELHPIIRTVKTSLYLRISHEYANWLRFSRGVDFVFS